jgi:hypothetical protein
MRREFSLRTCHLFLGNVWNSECTIIQGHIHNPIWIIRSYMWIYLYLFLRFGL